eukprot:6176447-Pleurochrysis_carterae.AAC.1
MGAALLTLRVPSYMHTHSNVRTSMRTRSKPELTEKLRHEQTQERTQQERINGVHQTKIDVKQFRKCWREGESVSLSGSSTPAS